MFGSTATSFGAPATTTAAPSSAFSFGQPPNTPASGPSSGGFSFGSATTSQQQPAAATPSGFGFGTSTTPAAAPGNAFSFGGSTTPAQPPNSSVSAFSFGGSAPPSTTASGGASGFSFGGSSSTPAASATSTATTTTPSFSFGNTTTTPASSGFGFASTTSTPAAPSAFSFGGSSGFGNTANKPATAFGFPSATTSTTSTTTSANAASSSMQAAAFANSPLDSLQGVRMAYTDPFQSRFKYMFYNAVDPAQKHLYTRPPHVGEKLWIQAQRDNPDPANLVPAAVVGFKELSTRIQLQQAHIKKFHGYAKDLVAQVQDMEKASRHTDVKLTQCRQQHIALFHRLVQLMRKLELFKQLRKPLHPSEHHLAATLKHVQSLLDNPTQFKAHMHELMTLQSMQAALPNQQRPDAQLTDEDMATVFRVLDKQREGLEHLTRILNQDLRDVQIMKKALEDDSA
ncbi:hypothetical protein H257_11738 [Aphanomyces astaci]|uniref:Nucleoporin Nup54 alpha-helical domain-containing protein n=1 Tax=Aphanomyces astaci TaxID=112090 RepID=W4G2Y8_APHAT|nr:hypothetical protein H257_11738 [Aphanomyces astaci]ETV73631.1 hypothetical protein H257_11738 [Aphanomyces astaci]|eukprot:XP_009837057.1 hypothetical protein H257_11738 [Aphanomyces astaci]